MRAVVALGLAVSGLRGNFYVRPWLGDYGRWQGTKDGEAEGPRTNRIS